MSSFYQRPEIYLDANATTPVLPAAAEAAMSVMRTGFGNPSSSHSAGIAAKALMERVRQQARNVIGARTGRVIFTSGATEGIQTAVVSALSAIKADPAKQDQPRKLLLYGATEHKAVPNTLRHWNALLGIGAEVVAIPVGQDGLLDQDFLARHSADALLICTMAVNNETGVKQDLQALEGIIRQANPTALWLVDCVQALGKVALSLSDISIDYAPFSGHKLYAMKGVGFLYVREGAPCCPFIAGGGQEQGLRSGTENLPGIASLAPVLDALQDSEHLIFRSHDTLQQYRQQLADTLKQCFPEVVFNAPLAISVPTTLNFAVPGLSATTLLTLFDAAGVRVSSGSACSSGASRSFVLDAMALPGWQSESAIRLSFGPADTQHTITAACQRLREAARALQQSPATLPEGLSVFADSAVLVAGKQAILLNPNDALLKQLKPQLSALNIIATVELAAAAKAAPVSLGDYQLAVTADGWQLRHHGQPMTTFPLPLHAAPALAQLPPGSDYQLIDVREPFEFALGHLPGAVNIPLSQLANRALNGNLEGKIVCYCRSGGRAQQGAEQLAGLGLQARYLNDSLAHLVATLSAAEE
ncbi:aminotransferase class V-fold PLP-dependent enzyme [Gallaecimonas sp. GXIMD1310]|uniref:aminotransferase class V-fold PLP-dependent enzyme n=1 Tax=Gallaecimonas sp. GXIMD1310 TaxID=3131926 RepID=UPI003246F85A